MRRVFLNSSLLSSSSSAGLSRAASVRLVAAQLCTALLCTVACQPAAEQPAEPVKGERIENTELGMAIAELPAYFQVTSNEGSVIELQPASAEVEGVLKVQESEAETGGINLVAAVERHKADLQNRENGEFKGQRELGSQLGTAFYSRGLYTEAGRTMEEVVIFLVHPKGDRELQLVYTYPAGEDSKERLTDHLFGVLEVLEELPVAPAADEAAEPEAAG